VQRIVTTAKGVSIDLDSLSRDVKAHSKELYLWGQSEGADLKDGARPRRPSRPARPDRVRQ
jgi:hypothetical protein